MSPLYINNVIFQLLQKPMVGLLQVQSKNEIFQSYAKHHPCHKINKNKKKKKHLILW